jgi:hypothetical protein
MKQQTLAFARCMRAHGVLNYPDPTFGPDGGIIRKNTNGVNPYSAPFQAAVKVCNP